MTMYRCAAVGVRVKTGHGLLRMFGQVPVPEAMSAPVAGDSKGSDVLERVSCRR